MRFDFHDPTGALEITQDHARRIDTLAGKRIGFLSNEQWQAHRMLPLLKSLIERDFPGAHVLPIDRYPQGNAEIPKESITALIKADDLDAVIVGNAS